MKGCNGETQGECYQCEATAEEAPDCPYRKVLSKRAPTPVSKPVAWTPEQLLAKAEEDHGRHMQGLPPRSWDEPVADSRRQTVSEFRAAYDDIDGTMKEEQWETFCDKAVRLGYELRQASRSHAAPSGEVGELRRLQDAAWKGTDDGDTALKLNLALIRAIELLDRLTPAPSAQEKES